MAYPLFPTEARLLFANNRRNYQPSILRLDMESGMPQQISRFTKVLTQDSVEIRLSGAPAYDYFFTWYNVTIARTGWFRYTTPENVQRDARFIGELRETSIEKPGSFKLWRISAEVEYYA